MKVSEALYVIKRLPGDTFYEGHKVKADGLVEIGSDIWNRKNTKEIQQILEEIFNYLLTLDFDPILLADILNEEGDCDYISRIKKDGSLEASGDDYDYVVFTGDDFYIWTEVGGRHYHLKDYGKTWTYSKHIPTADEIRRNEEWSKRTHEIISKCFDQLPSLVAADLVEVHPMCSLNNKIVEEYKKEK